MKRLSEVTETHKINLINKRYILVYQCDIFINLAVRFNRNLSLAYPDTYKQVYNNANFG